MENSRICCQSNGAQLGDITECLAWSTCDLLSAKITHDLAAEVGQIALRVNQGRAGRSSVYIAWFFSSRTSFMGAEG